ncbi:TPA: 2-oxo acid dehydrogenase subunit E2 [Legionella pneumophila]|nr:2-oxo acid dehydrogenase subunit E2 [Legionella pneumophila]
MKIFRLPDLGEGLAEAEVREWYVKVGDVVKVDQPLVSMETAKAVVDVPSPYAGKIVELHGKANEIVKTGAPLISFESSEVVSEKSADKGSVVGKLETSEKKWDDSDVIIGSARAVSKTIKAMPAARVLAAQMGVDLSQVTPTGPQGLITTEDVKKMIGAVAGHSTSGTTTALTGKTEALHGVRRVMAQAMMQSHKEIVPVTIIEDADITDLPPKCDLTARIMQAMVAAAKAEPALNAWFDGKTLERKLFSEVNIGMALDNAEGLFVPVIKHAETRSPEELRKMIDTYKETVGNRTIAPSDMQGATITLSNFGTIAGCYATPIIVPPAVAILGCGRYREVPVVRNGQVVPGRILPLSLTFDHRAVTGGEATRYLSAVIKNLK